ncbi:L-threonylcarbamoyladenylate synthase [Lacicoccus alkaliphilus]|uniref:Threonylcarbamoyl-AMP synthase n=1 Tax=Lacicoccus alkaliphilus DSM 16010 TaxID=1123231 RepID=A0A1M7ID83_9BACL|nr:L-threonylcarbamoyladenylate synthase [Salinicoccus alkaliphilus]SHM38645.1 L-threonylcarbamoyladenylate synthase [Salinicoccus alkaliphilus DSM 16010]
MKTKVWEISAEELDSPETAEKLEEIKTALTYGEIIGLPTETVYGLAGDARNPEAIQKIFQAKGRPQDNPLIVHIHDINQLEKFAEIPDERVLRLMEAFWPGPISFILPLKGGYITAKTVADLRSVAVRMPSHPVGLKILEYTDIPLAAPSANISGKPSPTDYRHVVDDLKGKMYGVVNSAPANYGIESTVLDCTTFPYQIARPGEITKADLERVLDEEIKVHEGDAAKPVSPGMKYKHYAPTQPLILIEGIVMGQTLKAEKDERKLGVIAPESFRSSVPDEVEFISLCRKEDDYREAAKNLYGALRKMDKSDVDKIYIYRFRENPSSAALLNRIYKATGDVLIKGEQISE